MSASASTPFTAPRPSAQAAYRQTQRRRLVAVGFGLGLALSGALGILLVSQARPVGNQPGLPSETAGTGPSEPAVPQAAVAPQFSPGRDAWYLEDHRLPVSDPRVAASEAPGVPLDLSVRTHDDWASRSSASARAIDLFLRAHDDWAVANSSGTMDLSPATRDDWPLDSRRQAP